MITTSTEGDEGMIESGYSSGATGGEHAPTLAVKDVKAEYDQNPDYAIYGSQI